MSTYYLYSISQFYELFLEGKGKYQLIALNGIALATLLSSFHYSSLIFTAVNIITL